MAMLGLLAPFLPGKQKVRLILVTMATIAPVCRAQIPVLPFGVRDDYSPAVALDSSGAPWIAWITSYADTSTSGTGDHVYAAHWTGAAWDTTRLTGAPGRLLDPQIAASSDRIHVAWVDLAGGEPMIVTRFFDGTWSSPGTISTGGGGDFAPSLCVDGSGTAWLAWQYLQNATYHIGLASSNPDTFFAHPPVSDDPANDREPDVAAAPDGSVWVAWSTIRNRHNEIFLRRWTGTAYEPAVQITNQSKVWANYPSIDVDADSNVWIAYYRVNRGWDYFHTAQPGSYDIGSIRLVCWDGSLVRFPQNAVNNSDLVPRPNMEDIGYDLPDNPIRRYGTRPHLTIDRHNRLWVFSKLNGYLEQPDAYTLFWGLYGVYYDGTTWSAVPEILLDRNAHFLNEPAVAMDGSGTAWLAWTRDRRETEPITTLPKKGNLLGLDSDVHVDTFVVGNGSGSSLGLGTAVLPGPASAGTARMVPRYTIDTPTATYQIYWGENHRHSCDFSSDGIWEYSFQNSFDTAFELVGYDWYASADHVEGWSPLGWQLVSKLTDLYRIPGTFFTYPGYERVGRNVFDPAGKGDQNATFLTSDDFYSADALIGPPMAWTDLYRQMLGKEVLVVPHHPADKKGYVLWDYLREPGADTLLAPLRLVEIFQTTRGSSEYPGCPFEMWKPSTSPDTGWVNLALEKGLRLGFCAGGDHDPGNGFTAVLAEEGTKEAIFEALRARRCYGTTFSKKLFLDFRINDRPMGEELISTEAPSIFVHASSADPITRITVIKDGDTTWATFTPNVTDTTISFADPDPIVAPGSVWYYARVEDADSGVAWSSPIWIDFVEPTDIVDSEGPLPRPGGGPDFTLSPVPFRPSAGKLEIKLAPGASAVRYAAVYSVAGRQVATIPVRGERAAWGGFDSSGRPVPPGIYLVRLVERGRGVGKALKFAVVR